MSNQTSAQSTNSVMAWLATPFRESQDAWHWVLFLGFAVIIVVFWRFILRQIIEAI
jgi:hypothetical protein